MRNTLAHAGLNGATVTVAESLNRSVTVARILRLPIQLKGDGRDELR